MNRREFMKWVGRLFAAIPFVALADLETKPIHAPAILGVGESEPAIGMGSLTNRIQSIPWDNLTASKSDMIWGTSLVQHYWDNMVFFDGDEPILIVDSEEST